MNGINARGSECRAHGNEQRQRVLPEELPKCGGSERAKSKLHPNGQINRFTCRGRAMVSEVLSAQERLEKRKHAQDIVPAIIITELSMKPNPTMGTCARECVNGKARGTVSVRPVAASQWRGTVDSKRTDAVTA